MAVMFTIIMFAVPLLMCLDTLLAGFDPLLFQIIGNVPFEMCILKQFEIIFIELHLNFDQIIQVEVESFHLSLGLNCELSFKNLFILHPLLNVFFIIFNAANYI